MITIVGAGPIGSYTAYLLAKRGIKAEGYEEHNAIGKPIQCTGIVSSEFSKIIPLNDKFVVNRLNKVKIFSKHRKAVLKIDDIVIDRAKFDKWLSDRAKKKGVKFYLNHKYMGIAEGKVVFADKKNKVIKKDFDKIIGADGPLSDVAKSNRMFGKRKFYTGIQARVKGNFDKDAYEVYLGSICPDFFAWIVPESEKIARIGLASKKDANIKFKNFLEAKKITNKNIIDRQAGLIPIWDKMVIIDRKNIYLIGDAAAQVKATTGGGIVPGLKAAKILIKCICGNKDYRKGLFRLNRELRIHKMIRKMLDKFDDEDYDNLVEMLANSRVKKVLYRQNRDNGLKLMIKLLLAEPRFLKYLIKII